jgi:steroid 5-alpha reductase family enzyme
MRAAAIVLVTYAAAGAVAVAVGHRVEVEHPIAVALWADLAATVAVFAFSLVFRNSSLYDPYWSVAPLPIAVYWAMRPEIVAPNPIRIVVVIVLVALWGARLTWNWARGWKGMGHQDWRYLEIRERVGAVAFWPASLVGIHLLPTLWVFAACLSLYPVMAAGREPCGYLDLAAFVVTFGAIGLEALADQQLLRFRRSGPPEGEFLKSGVWRWCRHPNYLGEMGFWWGLWLFGLAANPSWWWTFVGPLLITLMFRYASLPWMERRMRERRPAYAEYAERSSLVLPWPRRA